MTIGGSRCASQKRRGRESKPCRRHWSFFTLKKSGIPLRPGHRRGRFPSGGSTACARFSRRAPTADFVWVASRSKALMVKYALVCGAGGFIGGHLVRQLKHDGFWVRGVDLKFHEFSETEADD